jgi:hypothetical protein
MLEDIEGHSINTFKKILENLPFNRNKVYCEIFLDDSKCKLYIPLRDNIAEDRNALAAKKFYEKLANMAKF